MDKKAFELSINFLVIVIIAIVMLALGLKLITDFFGKATEIHAIIDEGTKAEINEMLSRGEQVAVPFNLKQISKGEQDTFGIGILNTAKTDLDFQIMIDFDKAFGTDDSQLNVQDAENWLLYDDEVFNLEPSENKQIPVLVQVPKNAKPGTYIFNVFVFQKTSQNDLPYGSTNKIRVIVN